jgi:hypothetical protein
LVKAPQAISFTSSLPASPAVGGTCTVASSVAGACEDLIVPLPRPSPGRKTALVNILRAYVNDLAESGWLTNTPAATLKTLASERWR